MAVMEAYGLMQADKVIFGITQSRTTQARHEAKAHLAEDVAILEA